MTNRTKPGLRAAVAAMAVAAVGCFKLAAFSPPELTTAVAVTQVTPGPSPTRGGTAASPTPATTPVDLSYLHQSAGSLVDGNGRPVTLNGIVWYGFETGDLLNSPATPTRLGSDVAVVMQRLHMMGFNLVSFPFAFAQMYNADGSYKLAPDAIKTACTGTNTMAEILASVTTTGFVPSGHAPLLTNVPAPVSGMCNEYLPDADAPVVQRLAAIVDLFTRNGFYVLLQQSMKHDPALFTDSGMFTSRWQALASDLIKFGGATEGISLPSCTADPNHTTLSICNRVLLGVMNEIDGMSPDMNWEANPPLRMAGAHQFFTGAMAAAGALLPRAMMLVGGALQNGYITPFDTGADARTANFPTAAGVPAIASAAGFFAEVLGTPLEPQMMFGFSAFGPVQNGQLRAYDQSFNTQIPLDLDPSFGVLATTGVPDIFGHAHMFPVLPAALAGNPSDPNDLAFLQAMQRYMGGHGLTHFVWYCWGATNTQSSIVDADFQSLNAPVVNYLQTLGLSPL